jgi:hypothetical protein
VARCRLDVLHGLHCLVSPSPRTSLRQELAECNQNELRKSFDPTYTPLAIHGELHTGIGLHFLPFLVWVAD